MKKHAAAALLALGAALLLWNLGRPALWQDESETALRAESVLESGVPRMYLRGVLVTAQPSLAEKEGNARGIWTWNTWLPAYLTAASFAALGRTPFAARLPFAMAGVLTLWLSWGMFVAAERDELAEQRPGAPEAGLALLVLSPAFLLFCRQSRYYALVALGLVLVVRSWRRLLDGGRGGALAVALSLQLLLHASFAFFAIAALALALDAALRLDECPRSLRFWAAAGLTLGLVAPVVWYFRAWDRPGNHAYAWGESLEFLKTFLLWLGLFSVPLAAFAGVLLKRRRYALLLACVAVLCGLVSEGPLSRACAVLSLAGVGAAALAEPAVYGVLNLRRLCLLVVFSTLLALSFTAAEPYGRYLAGILPFLAYLSGRWLADVSGGRVILTGVLVAAAAGTNLFSVLPLRAAGFLGAPDAPAESVSGMMRQRLRDAGPRSDLFRFIKETRAGARGYVEAAAAGMTPGETVFADADNLSLMFAARVVPVYPVELVHLKPQWLMPSPWLALDPAVKTAVGDLIASGLYAPVAVMAPRLLWQNNPDPLFRDFAPREDYLPLYRRR